MRITAERPKDDEIHLLYGKYGKPVIRELRFDMHEREEKQDYPECKGGSRVAVKMGDGVILVSGKGRNVFGLPGGRIWANESVEDGAVREAREETGLEIELKGLPELHKCQYLFKDWSLERWIFIFVALAKGGTLGPIDEEEIGHVDVFQKLPSVYKEDHWLHGIWNECLDL